MSALQIALLSATLMMSGAVLYSSMCRMNPLIHSRHKPLWICVFLLFGVAALVSIYQALSGRATWDGLLYSTAVFLYLWGSRHTWREGAPRYLEKWNP